jgi:hypothetical protein
MPTAELTSVSRATLDPMVLGDPLTFGAMDTFGIEKANDKFKDGSVVGEVLVKLIEGVPTLRCGASLWGVSVALAHTMSILQTSTCV